MQQNMQGHEFQDTYSKYKRKGIKGDRIRLNRIDYYYFHLAKKLLFDFDRKQS